MICNNNTTYKTLGKDLLYINVAANIGIAFFATFGNLLIVIIFLKHKKLRNLNNAAITLLAISDFVRGSFVVNTKIYNQLRFASKTTRPLLGKPICALTALASGFTLVFSPMLLALIAMIRYFIIVPSEVGREKFTKTKFKVTVLVMFSVATGFAVLPYMKVGKYRYTQSHGVCFTDWCDDNRTYRMIFYIIVIGVSFPILTVCYVTVFIALHKYCKEMSRSFKKTTHKDIKSSNNPATDPTKQCKEDLLENDDQQEGIPKDVIVGNPKHQENIDQENKSDLNNSLIERISKRENQITRVVLMIFLAFCICWLPACVVNIIAIDDVEILPIEWFYFIDTMVQLKCAIDPILYGLGNRNYWKASKRIICCK